MKYPVALVALLAALLPRAVTAQSDLSGYYVPLMHEDQPERTDGGSIGLELGDYLGLPINDAARLRADTWDAALMTLPEHQCKPHPSTYGMRGVGGLRIWYDVDETTQRLVKINTHIQWQEQRRNIWMDGRPHPPVYAPHTWQGFSTGRWEGGRLIVKTTHLKAGWVRRNGLPLSDRATMTDIFIRHGDTLTHVYIIEDPVYLTAPLVKTSGFRITPTPNIEPYPCDPAIEVLRPEGVVPHHLPGTNEHLANFSRRHRIPFEATRGGEATAMPEYQRKIAAAAGSAASGTAAR